MSVNKSKYYEVIDRYKENAEYATRQAREIVKAFSNAVPFPDREELNALVEEIKGECNERLGDYVSEEFLEYQAIILHLNKNVGIGTYERLQI